MNVQQIPNEEACRWIIERHYAHRMPCVQYAFGLFESNITTGIVTYGQPATPHLKRGICGPDFQEIVLELNRLCVSSPSKNAASFLVGNSLSLLPKPTIVVSYADTKMAHIGYIYQATNFLYTGLTEDKTDYFIKGMEGKHSRHTLDKGVANTPNIVLLPRSRKHRYIIFTGNKTDKKKLRRELRYPISPYPKGDTKRYDASASIPIQSVLF